MLHSDSPKFEKPIERQVNVYEGQNVRLECHTDAVPVANISWIKDDSRLSRNVEVKENLAVMTLEKATREVEGDYICLAENALGRHQQVVSVSVTEGVFSASFLCICCIEILCVCVCFVREDCNCDDE